MNSKVLIVLAASDITNYIQLQKNGGHYIASRYFLQNVISKIQPIFLFLAKKSFKMALLNITRLPKHIDELRVFLAASTIDILAINGGSQYPDF